MAASTYYPSTNDGRGHWWENIRDNGADALKTIGFAPAQVTAVTNDAAWGVYAYLTARHAFDDFSRAVTAYADGILHGTPDGQLPAPPVVPDFPTPPTAAVLADLEGRREKWVQQAKNLPGYDASLGAALGIETAAAGAFRDAEYQCELSGLSAPNAHTVSGKFRKARGNVEGINLYGRRAGTTAWQGLGRFTATPFSASVPVAGPGPEAWEFRAVAVRRDVEFGVPSVILEQIVRP